MIQGTSRFYFDKIINKVVVDNLSGTNYFNSKAKLLYEIFLLDCWPDLLPLKILFLSNKLQNILIEI